MAVTLAPLDNTVEMTERDGDDRGVHIATSGVTAVVDCTSQFCVYLSCAGQGRRLWNVTIEDLDPNAAENREAWVEARASMFLLFCDSYDARFLFRLWFAV